MKKDNSEFVKEFAKFLNRGNVIDLAVGIIIGGAFSTLVNTLVSKVFTPVINWIIYLLCGQELSKFSGLDITLIPAQYDENNNIISEATILSFSSLISSILNFVLVGLILFIIVKSINKIRDRIEEIKKEEGYKLNK